MRINFKKTVLFLVLALMLATPLVQASQFYQVIGNSMNPTVKDGDIIEIIEGEEWQDGDMVVAELQDGTKVIKRLDGDKLVGDNHGNTAIYYVSDVTILGKAKLAEDFQHGDNDHLEKVFASTPIALQAGDLVNFGGRQWRVATISSGRPYLVMTTDYGTSRWNAGGEYNLNGYGIFSYLTNNFNNIIFEVAHRDWVDETTWNIQSCGDSVFSGGTSCSGTTTLEGVINPQSFYQKLGVISAGEWNLYKNNIGITGNRTWTRSPYSDSRVKIWGVMENGTLNNGNFDADRTTLWVRPALYLKSNYSCKDINGNVVPCNQPPTLTLTNPANNQTLSEVTGYNELNIAGQAHDPDVGDIVSVKYTINGIVAHTNRTLFTYTSNGSVRNFNEVVPIDSSIPEGTYTLRIWAEDDKGGISSETIRTIIVDKTKPTIQANPTEYLAFGLDELDITVTLNDNLSGIEERMYHVSSSSEIPTTWTAAPSNNFNVKLGVQGDWYLHVFAKDNAGNEHIESFGIYRLMTEIPPPVGWEDDEDLQPINLPNDFDPDNMDGKLVEFEGKKAVVVVGRYIHLSAQDISYATHYAISLDGFGYSDYKPLTDGGFEESIWINTPGLYPVHLKLKNVQYNVESEPFIRNYLVDWITPTTSSETKIKGQTATTNGTLTIKATGTDNLSPMLYNAGSGWQWFTSGQDITITGIPLNNQRNDAKVRFSDLNGNVVEEVHKIWGISN